VDTLLDLLFHLDDHLKELVQSYGTWTYAILFLIIFAETGIVIAPFLPGDSLLFAAGAVAALKTDTGGLDVSVLCMLLIVAAILGDTANYHIGYFLGPRVFKNPKSFWLNSKHLDRTQEFFDRYGGKTIILARFLPIVRTLAPFVAGVGKMNYGRFLLFNVVGAVVWVLTFVLLGYFFGTMEFVQKNFELVIFAIIGISLLPGLFEVVRHRYAKKVEHKPIEQAVEE
jgi:membrane-associated protein